MAAPLHPWDVTPAEARAMQPGLAGRVDSNSPLPPPATVAGTDISYDPKSDLHWAAVVVVRVADGAVVERAHARVRVTFPYVPGLLSFRECPPVLAAYSRLRAAPGAVMVDGQGTAHPLRLGLACHLGLWLGVPTVGCAKSRLCGRFAEVGPEPGDWSPLIDRGETVGAVLRTRRGVKPIFVSPGHRCDLPGALAVANALRGRYRVPTPTRLAHAYANELRAAARDAPEAVVEGADNE